MELMRAPKMHELRRMRPIIAAGLMLAVVGCGTLSGSRDNRPAAGPVNTQTPTADKLINYVNANAARVESLESTDLGLEVKQGSQGGGLSGALFCQKPRNFRLRAKAVGKPMADFGSNDDEFWYWISQDKPPYLYHCSYADFSKGNVPLPFPFQPDWVLETLGMATLKNPVENFRVDKKGDKWELIERDSSLQGRPVFKATVFDARNTSGNMPQITQYRLHDEKGEAVAIADVLSVRRDAATGATVPTHVKLRWPGQKGVPTIEMEMKLDGLKVHSGPVVAQRSPELFQRPNNATAPSFDLATGRLDGTSSGLQSTGGLGGR